MYRVAIANVLHITSYLILTTIPLGKEELFLLFIVMDQRDCMEEENIKIAVSERAGP